MANMMGALIGAAIDRRDGDSGLKGALAGAALQRGLRLALPAGAALLLAMALKRRFAGRRDRGAADRGRRDD